MEHHRGTLPASSIGSMVTSKSALLAVLFHEGRPPRTFGTKSTPNPHLAEYCAP